MSETFIVEARMREPIVTHGDGLHIDGPLAYAAYMNLPPERRATVPPIESDWADDFDLPLERWESPCDLPETADARLTVDGLLTPTEDGYTGTVWGWACSAAVPIGTVLNAQHNLRKRPAIESMVTYTSDRRFEIGAGPRKAKDLVFPTVQARTIRWYCCGDAERTRWLLARYVPAIGKLSRHGPGRVEAWEVAETDDDFALRGPDGRPMRRLPARMFLDRQAVLGTFRAPYHHRSRWAMVVEAEPKGIQ